MVILLNAERNTWRLGIKRWTYSITLLHNKTTANNHRHVQCSGVKKEQKKKTDISSCHITLFKTPKNKHPTVFSAALSGDDLFDQPFEKFLIA